MASSKSDFSLTDSHGYTFERSHLEAFRLNLQFYLWKDALKFNIHPSIPAFNSSAIADVATGTAIWLIDVARSLPSAQLDGFDIAVTQAPHQKWLPSNIAIRHWNIFEDVPDDLIGKYDIVHVRLLVLVIDNADPRAVMRNLFKLLKPGGYLQWDELDIVNMTVKKASPSIQSPALDQLCQMSRGEGRFDWTLQLAMVMTEVGFEDAKLEHFGDGNELIRAFHE